MLRALALSVTVVALWPASASAVIGERMVPIYDEADGVHLELAGERGISSVRFDRTPTASKLWRRLSGRQVEVSCGSVDPRGSAGTVRGVTVRDRRVRLVSQDGADVCTLSTRRKQGADCPRAENSRRNCVRVVLALDDVGRRHLEDVVARWDLLIGFTVASIFGEGERPDFSPLVEQLGDGLAELPDAGASPPAGKLGYWAAGMDFAVVAVTPSGKRLFISLIGGAVSTNAGILGLTPPSLGV
jgi:hypothetical protein